jgi:hypothetical protein
MYSLFVQVFHFNFEAFELFCLFFAVGYRGMLPNFDLISSFADFVKVSGFEAQQPVPPTIDGMLRHFEAPEHVRNLISWLWFSSFGAEKNSQLHIPFSKYAIDTMTVTGEFSQHGRPQISSRDYLRFGLLLYLTILTLCL